jgi:hypothetical protein
VRLALFAHDVYARTIPISSKKIVTHPE